MPASGGSPFGEFDDAFRDAVSSTKSKKEEKGLPWAAKKFDGKLYLPLEQVVELLKINDALPAVRRGLEKHL